MANSLVDLLFSSVQQSPDAEAVVFNGKRLSYKQLWERINSVAAFLLERGLQKGDRVAILLENSPEYVISYYAALLAGGVAVGLNTMVKAPNVINWLKHCDAKWVILSNQLPEFGAVFAELPAGINTICVTSGKDTPDPGKVTAIFEDIPAMEGIGRIGINIQPSDLAAIIYTSGTTGNPKGVTLSHKNLHANVSSILEYLKLRDSDKILNVLPFYYSYGNSVMHTHLAVGGTLVLENSLAYPHRVVEKMVQERVTGFSGVPSTFALLLSRVNFADYDLSGIRYMTQAGGAMSPAHVQRIIEEIPHMEFFIMYGQTEATARICYLPPDKLQQKRGSAGKAIPGVNIEIRDEQGEPLPPGESGEIYVSGDNIMNGYWNNPEATKSVVTDGWLKTGDLAKMDEEGYIFIEGRSSEMIKSGAHRISPKEIEEAILELDDVAEVAVVGVADDILGEVIKAFVILRKGAHLDKKQILAHCRSRLPFYKIPKLVEFTTELPKTASGKIKRYLLQ